LNNSSVSLSRSTDGPASSLSCAAAGCHADVTSSSATINSRAKRAIGDFIARRLAFPGLNR
jgi:hypothetical protein